MTEKVKQYCELEAITRFYQFEQMNHNHFTNEEERIEYNRLYKLWIDNLKRLEVIQRAEKANNAFWDEVDKYRYKHAQELINAGDTFNLKAIYQVTWTYYDMLYKIDRTAHENFTSKSEALKFKNDLIENNNNNIMLWENVKEA